MSDWIEDTKRRLAMDQVCHHLTRFAAAEYVHLSITNLSNFTTILSIHPSTKTLRVLQAHIALLSSNQSQRCSVR